MTSEFPRVDVIKKFWDHVLTWSWCHIYSGTMISWFIFTCLFFYCSKTHKMALPYQARHSRIVKRSHEFQSLCHLSILRFRRKCLNHGTIGKMSMKNYHRYVLSASLFFEWTFSLPLVECYFQLNQSLLFRVLDGLT